LNKNFYFPQDIVVKTLDIRIFALLYKNRICSLFYNYTQIYILRSLLRALALRRGRAVYKFYAKYTHIAFFRHCKNRNPFLKKYFLKIFGKLCPVKKKFFRPAEFA